MYLTPEAICCLGTPKLSCFQKHRVKKHLECKSARHQIDRCTCAWLFKHLAELCVELHTPCDVRILPSRGVPRERAHHRSAPENKYGIAIIYFPTVNAPFFRHRARAIISLPDPRWLIISTFCAKLRGFPSPNFCSWAVRVSQLSPRTTLPSTAS